MKLFSHKNFLNKKQKTLKQNTGATYVNYIKSKKLNFEFFCKNHKCCYLSDKKLSFNKINRELNFDFLKDNWIW